MKGMTAFEKINDIHPFYIAESELPPEDAGGVVMTKRPNPVVRFFSSGVGVALLCGIVSFTVTFLIVMAGRNANVPVVTPPDSEAVTSNSQDTDATTEGESEYEVIITLPEESEALTEPETEAPTQAETQQMTEAETKPETEPETLWAVTEAITEPITEPETEAETEPYVPVTGISISQKLYEMKVGESFHMEVTLYPENATDMQLSWSSSNEYVAEIHSDSGKITAHRQGTTTITATVLSTLGTENPISITCEIKVEDVISPTDATQGLSYTWNGDYYTWKGMGQSTEKNVVLPEYVNGKPLKIIDLTYQDLNDVGVESVIFSSTVESIATQAFVSTRSLKEITFTGDIVVGQQAFLQCDSLTTVNGWEHITEMKTSAFGHCSSLESVTIYPHTTYGTTPFLSSGLKNVTFATGVTKISDMMFRQCYELTTIDLPEDLSVIGSQAFAASGLTSIELPPRLTALGVGAFSETELVSVHIPEGIETLSSQLFYACDLLREVKTPDTVTKIEGNVFSYCAALEDIHLPDNLQSLGAGAFSYCTKLGKVEIPETVTEIGSSCFAGCSALTDVNIPTGLTRIEEYTFQSCKSLAHITLPETLTYIGNMAFAKTSIEDLYIPAKVTHINNSAFAYNENLKTVTFADNAELTHLYDNVFCECTSLQAINLPDSLTYLGGTVFQDCSSLAWAYVGNSLTRLGTLAFDGCVSLDHIYLPATLSTMASGICVSPFKDCKDTFVVYTGMINKPIYIESSIVVKTNYTYEQYVQDIGA